MGIYSAKRKREVVGVLLAFFPQIVLLLLLLWLGMTKHMAQGFRIMHIISNSERNEPKIFARDSGHQKQDDSSFKTLLLSLLFGTTTTNDVDDDKWTQI